MNWHQILRKTANFCTSAVALSVLAFSAQAVPIVVNGSFENTGTYTTSVNITGPTTTPITLPGWNTTVDGIGCVHSPGDNALTQVCGPFRFSSNAFWADPGESPVDMGNYVLIDGDMTTNFPNTPSTALFQTLNDIVAGQSYYVNFWQAAAQFTDATGPTTERWDVSLGGTITNAEGNFSDGLHALSDTMTTPSRGVHGWQYQSLRFDVPLGSPTSQVLAFFSVGTPGGLPPVVLLDGVSITTVPEPETIALLGIGLLGILATSRQQRKSAPLRFRA